MKRTFWIFFFGFLIGLGLMAAALFWLGPQLWGDSTETASVQSQPNPTAAATQPPAASHPDNGDTPTLTYQVYFTSPKYPGKPENYVGGLDTTLVALIDTAKRTLDIAVYDFDLENVAQALERATKRGVRVRFVTDTDTLTNQDKAVQRAFGVLRRAKIPIVDDQRPAIMHDKFLVLDNATVWTGSWNFTTGDTYRLNNNAIRIDSAELARNYTAEFEQMFVQHKFGPAKQPGTTYQVVTLSGIRVENYFAPKEQVAEQLANRLRAARKSIQFMAFSFTSDLIGQPILERAKEGVSVQGVFETTGSETEYSEYGRMKKAGLDVWQDGNPYSMHHKVCIIDGRMVAFGSFNFSNNADRDNDENLLIMTDPALVKAFQEEFKRVYAQAKAKRR